MQRRGTRCQALTDSEPQHTYGPVTIDAQPLGRIPAAEYLRVSRCDQTNGLVAQARNIRAYADTRGFLVVKTYVDHGRTGLVIRGRKGLQKLMEDVLGGSATYKAVLVNDVSRWGRFQDSDEAAHYEFLCKQAGVPIHYCSETCAKFPASAQAILKNIRRTMAGEYSRELSDKCFHAQKHLAQLGYRVGGKAGYGFRRFALSANGGQRLLQTGQYKSLVTDRIVLKLGPAREVACVRNIFELVLKCHYGPTDIARQLNNVGATYNKGRAWNADAVRNILRNPKYAGMHVWNRNSRRLHTLSVPVHPADWVTRYDVIPPIVDKQSFEQVQGILRNRQKRWSDADLLQSLRDLRSRKGYLSTNLIASSPGMASIATYHRRFGPFRKLYPLIGFSAGMSLFGKSDQRQLTQALHDKVVAEIAELFRKEVSVVHLPHKRRLLLQMSSGSLLSVLMCVRTRDPKNRSPVWVMNPVPGERKLFTLLCFCNESKTKCLRYYLVPRVTRARVKTTYTGPLLKTGVRLSSLSQIYPSVTLLPLP